jgi:hypothetical protein
LPKRRLCLGWTSERIDQIKLHTVKSGVLLSRCHAGGSGGVLQRGVERAPEPIRVCGRRIASNSPQPVNTVLQNVRLCSLVTLDKGRENRILFYPVPGVANLNIVLVSLLPDTEIRHVRLILATQIGAERACRTKRMRLGLWIVDEFKQQVERQTGRGRLDLIVQDKIGVQKLREEVAGPYGAGGVGKVVWGKDAIGTARRNGKALDTALAAGSLTRRLARRECTGIQ